MSLKLGNCDNFVISLEKDHEFPRFLASTIHFLDKNNHESKIQVLVDSNYLD